MLTRKDTKDAPIGIKVKGSSIEKEWKKANVQEIENVNECHWEKGRIIAT